MAPDARHEPPTTALAQSMSLDDRDDEPDYKLEQVRLSLAGLTASDQLELPDDTNSLRAASWDISDITRLGMGSHDTGGDHGGTALVGILQESCESFDILLEHDELQSGRYSGVLDDLRSRLLANLPCVTEVMLSRAIINEFSSNDDADDNYSSSRSTLGKREGDNTEADHLFDLIHYWLGDTTTTREEPSAEVYFEQSLCHIMHQIRTEELRSADQAYCIVHMLAVGLGLHEDCMSSVVLIQLPKQISRASLFDEFSYFGKVMALGVSRKQPLFAYCRFSKEESITSVLSCRDQGAILIRGHVRPKLQSLSKLQRSWSLREKQAEVREPQFGSYSPPKVSKFCHVDLDILESTGSSTDSPTCVAKDIHSSIFR